MCSLVIGNGDSRQIAENCSCDSKEKKKQTSNAPCLPRWQTDKNYLRKVLTLTLQLSTFLFYVVVYHFGLLMMCMQNSYDTIFDAHQMRISTTYVSSVMLGLKQLEIRNVTMTVKIREEKHKHNAVKLSQIRRRIELLVCVKKIILIFEMNL
jgi:hypothetical protein